MRCRLCSSLVLVPLPPAPSSQRKRPRHRISCWSTGASSPPNRDAVGRRSRFAAIGSSTSGPAPSSGSRRAGTRVVDVGGRMVIPGINDAHTHVGARHPDVAEAGDDPTVDGSRGDPDAAAATPADQWIYGTIGERVLLRSEGDAPGPRRGGARAPRETAAWTGHGNILSTAAMHALGIGDRDPDPPFGRYGRLDGRRRPARGIRRRARASRMTALAGSTAAIVARVSETRRSASASRPCRRWPTA